MTKKRDTIALNELGCYTIAMLSKTERAVQFRKAVAKFIQTFRIHGDQELKKLELELLRSRQKTSFVDFRLGYYIQKDLIRTKKDLNNTKSDAIRAMVKDGMERWKIAKYLNISMESLDSLIGIMADRKESADAQQSLYKEIRRLEDELGIDPNENYNRFLAAQEASSLEQEVGDDEE